MAKEKVTTTVDRSRLDEVRALVGAPSASATIDFALAALIRQRRLENDVALYRRLPSTSDEIALAQVVPDWSRLEDDTDWEALYPPPTG